MADYGLKIWDKNGVETFNTSDIITRNRYVTTIPKDQTGSFTIDGIANKNKVAIILPIGNPTLKSQAQYSISNDIVSYTFGNINSAYTISSLFFIFLYS